MHLRDGQILILRSTVFPGTPEESSGIGLRGWTSASPSVPSGWRGSLREIRQLPQITQPSTPRRWRPWASSSARFTHGFLHIEPMEAELCKLMTNAWRYIQFATVNQFFMIASRTAWTSTASSTAAGTLPAYGRHAGPGLRRRPLPVQGHHAAGRLQPEHFTLGHSAMCQRGPARPPVGLAQSQRGAVSEAAIVDPGHGVQGQRTILANPCATSFISSSYTKSRGPVHRRLHQGPFSCPLEDVIGDRTFSFLGAPHRRPLTGSCGFPVGRAVIDIWNWMI